MIKKNTFFIISLVFSILILSSSLVSAGLCKGSDGYYHDCNDFSDRYYKNNFYPNYKTEYYQEVSSSSSSIISIKEDRYNYEEIKANSYAESNIEYIKTERDYSRPKIVRSQKNYDYWDKWFGDDYDSNYDNYNDRYEWDDEPHMVIFLNKDEPIHQIKRDYVDSKRNNYYDDNSDWRYDRDSDYYYQPRYSYYKDNYNWDW